jgi:hypothetical protein
VEVIRERIVGKQCRINFIEADPGVSQDCPPTAMAPSRGETPTIPSKLLHT